MNPIDYLVSKGFRITSDPSKYRSGIWGKRDYTVDGYNHDGYCGGHHRAYDLSKHHLAPVPSVCDGIVAAGTKAYGNFGGTVVIANEALDIQVIYGHLSRNLPVRAGQKVKAGQTIGHQSNTNYQGVQMNSHLHIQFQKYGYIKNERDFVCTGIDPLNIVLSDVWLKEGKFVTDRNINIRTFPNLKAGRSGVLPAGSTAVFDRYYASGSHWWLRFRHKGAVRFIAAGQRAGGKAFGRTGLWGKLDLSK